MNPFVTSYNYFLTGYDSYPVLEKLQAKYLTLTGMIIFSMIFFFSAYKYVSNYRYTYFNPATILKFIVVTKTDESADKLQLDWIIESTKDDERNAYTTNLLILSEDEFLMEYETQAPFREMLGGVIVVYSA